MMEDAAPGTLRGKRALVTGAGRGIGRAEALLLAREGASVIVNDTGVGLDGRRPHLGPAEEVVAEIRELGGHAVADGSDISTWEGARRLVDRAVREFGGLDVVVNNAGILRDRTIVNLEQPELDHVLAVHLRGHAGVLHFAACHWREVSKTHGSAGASVINTASEVGLFGNPGQAAYAAAKGAIVSLSLTAALELRRYGIRVNVVCPRARTRMTLHAFGSESMTTAGGLDEWAPENVAPMVAFLASGEAADITGQVFIVGGSRVRLMRGWVEQAAIQNDGAAFDLRALQERVHELFASAPSVLAPTEMLPGQAKA
jgi:NAD(P)-dependent dehydrogenase (short-subunit alcohol dehydrogenase family)